MTSQTIDLHSEVSRRDDILTTDLDGEIGMLNVETGKYYALDHVSAEIWKQIEHPVKVQQIVDDLMSQYEVDEPSCIQQTTEFLEKLLLMKLIVIHNKD